MKIFVANTDILASEMNINFGLGSQTLTYDTDNRLSTVTDTTSGQVLTFSYNDDDDVTSITDGVNTWTFAYNSDGDVTGVTLTP